MGTGESLCWRCGWEGGEETSQSCLQQQIPEPQGGGPATQIIPNASEAPQTQHPYSPARGHC